MQMEDVLKDVPHGVAVYYDQNGLDADAKPARLDVRECRSPRARVSFIPRTSSRSSKTSSQTKTAIALNRSSSPACPRT